MVKGDEFTVTAVGTGKDDGWIAIDNGLCEPWDGMPASVFPGGYWFDRFEKVS